jgi:predicted dehydrogenase
MGANNSPQGNPVKTYNVGVVGYGWVAGAHIAAINATRQAKVASIYSSRPLKDSEVSAKHGGAIRTFTNFEQFLSDESMDAVAICSYPQDHAKQAIAAARAGKHLIIEKPLALSWGDCLDVQQAVKAAGVKTCVCFECRYSSQFLATKSILDRGLLGRIHYGEVDYYHGIGSWYGQFRWNTRKDAGGSSLLSAGCHAMDALLLCIGGDVESVTSASTRSSNTEFSKYEYPTSSVTILKFRDGRIGKVASVIDCLQPYYFHVHLVGSEGSLLDNKFHSTQIAGLNKNQWSELSMRMLDSGDVSDHPYQTQFQSFFDALDGAAEMPLTNIAEALRSHEVIFAADRSAETGAPVTLAAG